MRTHGCLGRKPQDRTRSGGGPAGLSPFLPFGYATRKGNMLYLHIRDWSGKISVPACFKARNAYLLADPSVKVGIRKKDGQLTFSLPPFAPDPAVSILAVECDGRVPTQGVPTEGLGMTVDGKVVPELTDSDYKSTWTAEGSGKETVEITFPQYQTIQCMATVEPWQVWDGINQEYTVEALVGGEWKRIADGKGDGTGTTLPFAPVKAKSFRVTVRHTEKDVSLRQLMLFN